MGSSWNRTANWNLSAVDEAVDDDLPELLSTADTALVWTGALPGFRRLLAHV